MPDAHGFYHTNELVWPITVRWKMVVPWGLYRIDLHLDVGALENDPIATGHFINELWKAAIAPAMSFFTVLLEGAAYCHKLGMAVDRDHVFPIGEGGVFPLGRDKGIALVLQTGYEDKWGRRRLILPTCPHSWVDSTGQVTPHGAGELLTYARGLFAGLFGNIENSPISWWIVHPEYFKDPVTGLSSPGWREVTSLRVCSYTVPVPDNGLEPI